PSATLIWMVRFPSSLMDSPLRRPGRLRESRWLCVARSLGVCRLVTRLWLDTGSVQSSNRANSFWRHKRTDPGAMGPLQLGAEPPPVTAGATEAVSQTTVRNASGDVSRRRPAGTTPGFALVGLGQLRNAIDVRDRVALDRLHARPRRHDSDQIQGIAGRESHDLAAPFVASRRPERLDGLGRGELLADEAPDQAASPQLAAHLHPAIDADQIAPDGSV